MAEALPFSLPEGGSEVDVLAQRLSCALPAGAKEAAAQMLAEYSSAPDAATSWEAFVAHNWLPVLSLALGSEWRSKYDGEVAAMIALQLSLQPRQCALASGGGCASDGGVSNATTATSSLPPASQQPAAPTATASTCAPQPLVAMQAAPAPPAAGLPMAAVEARAFTVEAVDVDGKRRRLRRKRAASPDSPYGGAAASPDGGAAPFAASAPAPSDGPADGEAVENGTSSSGLCGESDQAGSPNSSSVKPTAVQRVIRQVSKLSISTPATSAAGSSPVLAAGSAAAALAPGGGTAAVPPEAEHAPLGLDSGSSSSSSAAPEVQQGLLDSLSLVHDLSQRIVANLQKEVAACGLSLSEQVAAPGGCAAMPLSMLLGGSLVDRMDLLGRSALHVAAATGRADIVGQLVAAGASPGKALPMDYRTLLKQQPEGEGRGEGEGQEGDPDGGASCGGSAPRHNACCALDGCPTDAPCSQRRCGGSAPPPKRGRYVTVGPPDVGPPSLQYCTPLHLAALYGHLEVVAALLATGQCDVNARSIDGATPLHLAAWAGHERVASRLCRARGVQLDAPDLQGRTPLHAAAARGWWAVVMELWGRGAAVDPADLHGWTPLHYAARAGRDRVAGQLIIAGASVAACDAHAVAPAHLAAERGFTDIVGKLLLAGYVADSMAGPLADGSEGGTPLHLAAAQGCAEVVEVLLCAGADPRLLDFSARNALDLAVLNGHTALVPPLLAAGCWLTGGAGAEEYGGQPGPGQHPPARQLDLLRCLAAEEPSSHPAWVGLGDGGELVAESFCLSFAECAARAGQLEVLRALEARGLRLDARAGCAVLAAAVHSGSAPLVAWLLEGGRCDVGSALQQEDLLHEAASRGDVGVLRALLAAAGGGALARTDGRGLGRTPLHCAVIHGQAAAAELLIAQHQQGADAATDAGEAEPAGLDAPDSQGYTPLCWAAVQGATRTLRRLLAAGASPSAACGEGLTPLHLAAKSGHVGAVHALLEAGAPLATADQHGCMPLHYCALRGDLALFVLLFSPSAPALAPAPGAGAALLTAAIRGGSSEMVGIVLMTGAASPAKCRQAGQTPVHAAAREGGLDALQYLYGSGFDMTELDAERKSPLHHAAIGCGQAALAARRGADHRQVAEVLLAAGCAVDAADAHGCTPLHFAAGAGALALLSRFLELCPAGAAGADRADAIGWTPLFWACNNGHAAAAERLLAEGASPWSQDCNRRLPLHFAAEAGHAACVRLLVAAMRRSPAPAPLEAAPARDGGASPPAGPLEVLDQNGQTPVQLAAEHGHPDCVALLLDADGTAEAKRRTALHLAAAQGRVELARQVLAAARAAVSAKDADGWLPIHGAAAAGHADIVAALLAAGSDVEDPAADGDSPLHKAALGGHLEVVRLLKGRAQLDQRNASGSTALYNAASQGHLAVMRELAEEGAAVDAATTNGCSPLYIAANNGWAAAAGLLLELGAHPDAETSSGCTPLHAAALNGHAAVVERLVAAGCDVDLQSQNGSSALHNAASGGHVAVLDVLLGAKADCDVQNSNGNTPLHLAAGKGWAEAAERLAAAGADGTIKNSKGWLAIQSAANSGCFEVVLRLVQHGSPWRLKGEADVVKLLSRKSSYKPSYVEGRLRLAEKERQRRVAKLTATEAAGPAGGGEADLRQAAAQADAVMAALLEEEEADRERAERAKAKKAAKKQKQAAKKQQQEEEQRRAAEEEQRAQAAEAEAAQRAAAEAEAAEAAAGRAADAGDENSAAVPPPSSPRSSAGRGPAPDEGRPPERGSRGSGKGSPSSRPPAAPAPAPKVLSPPNNKPESARSSTVETGLKPLVASGGKQGKAAGSQPGERRGPPPPSPPGSQAGTPVKQPVQPVVAPPSQRPTAAERAGPGAAASAPSEGGQVQPRRPTGVAPAPPTNAPAAARLAPWAGVAAARASQVQQQPPGQHAVQPAAVEAGAAQQAPSITRPAHIRSILGGPGLQLQHPASIAAAAASLGLGPRLAAPWTAPPAPLPQPPSLPPSVAASLHAPPPVAATARLPPAGAHLLQAAMQPPQCPPSVLQQAPARLAGDASGMHQPVHPSRPVLPPAALGPGQLLRQEQAPQAAGSSAAAAAGFVPLFGLNLPTLQGLSVDWSVPAAAANSFGSPARQHAAPLPQPPLAAAPAAAAGTAAAAGFVGGSFSPSDASSVESEAEDLLGGFHGHLSRSLPAGGAAASGRPRAAPPAAKAALPASSGDADGIDDVLRLQPWLNE